MKAPNFLQHRMETSIRLHGIEYTFVRSGTDKFGQPTSDTEEVATIKGIYHETNSYIQTKNSDATTTRTKKSPMVMCMYQDAQVLRQGDMVVICDKQYKVSGVLDVQNYSIVADISLEEVV